MGTKGFEGLDIGSLSLDDLNADDAQASPEMVQTGDEAQEMPADMAALAA